MKKNPVLSLALTLVSLPAFAGSATGPGRVRLFGDAPAVFSIREPYVPRTMTSEAMRPNIGSMIMGGVLGNILGSLGGIYLGWRMTSDEDDIMPLLLCWGAGSAFGSATGASLAGHSRYWQGNFGMAMIGGALGAGLSWLVVSLPTFQGDAGMLSLVPLILLPPVVSAIFYRSSMRPRRFPKPGALLNLSAGRLGLGIPAIHVRPLFVPGTDARPDWQYSARVLSLEL